MCRNKIAFCNYHDELNRDNFLFTNENVGIGDNLLLPMIRLREFAERKLIKVATTDCIDVTEADAIVFIDMPDANKTVFLQAVASRKPLYLIVLESRIVRPENYDIMRLDPFKIVFTYDDSIVDGKKFIKLNYAFSLPEKIDSVYKQKLCVMISGNKNDNHPQELYSERKQVIRWFEKNHLEDFDLYGFGWDKYSLGNMKLHHYLNPLKLAKTLFHRDFPSFKGTVERKKPILAKYKFAICYENVEGIPGYITEKIFDAFFAGTVPVYLGASNVQEHIPSGCFIDRRKFISNEALYVFMKEMDDATYNGYLDKIRSYIGGSESEEFSINKFVTTIDKYLFAQL